MLDGHHAQRGMGCVPNPVAAANCMSELTGLRGKGRPLAEPLKKKPRAGVAGLLGSI